MEDLVNRLLRLPEPKRAEVIQIILHLLHLAEREEEPLPILAPAQ